MGKAPKRKRAPAGGSRGKESGPGNDVRRQEEGIFRTSATKTVVLIPVAVILLVSFAVYVNALSNDFVYDDSSQVLKNYWIRDVRNLPKIFTKSVWAFQSAPVVSNYYRPVMNVVYMLNYHLFGLAPWGFPWRWA